MRPKTVLVVDDDPAVRRVIAMILKQHGYSVIEADCGWKGLERFAEHRNTIELVLSDVVMPQMSGVEMIQRILAVDPSVTVMLMTGCAMDARLSEGVPVISKPFTQVTLIQAIGACLASRVAPADKS